MNFRIILLSGSIQVVSCVILLFSKDNRNVELTGEAYFQVEAEPSVRFM